MPAMLFLVHSVPVDVLVLVLGAALSALVVVAQPSALARRTVFLSATIAMFWSTYIAAGAAGLWCIFG